MVRLLHRNIMIDVREKFREKFSWIDCVRFKILSTLSPLWHPAKQENEDVEMILKSNLLQADYFKHRGLKSQTAVKMIRQYVRSWAFRLERRKLFPGFHPGIYQEQQGDLKAGVDPLADYLRRGRPTGPWTFEVLSPNSPHSPPFKEKKQIISSTKNRIGLHIHAYYPELIPNILERLIKNQIDPDLFFSVPTQEAYQEVSQYIDAYLCQSTQKYLGKFEIRVTPNRGRDIGPFLTEFGKTIVQNYDFIGHVHTKKLMHLKNQSIGSDWFHFLLENLLGGQYPMADLILEKMINNQQIGLICPDDPHVIGWGRNAQFATYFLKEWGIQMPQEFIFPIGTMFWARPHYLKSLFDLNLGWEDYPEEPLPGDGSALHALERLFGIVVLQAGGSLVLTYVPGVSR